VLVSGKPRAVVDSLPQYKPGKSAAQSAADHQLNEAIKLASNESSYGPLPSVLDAVADGAKLLNRYPDHRGEALRVAISERQGVSPDQVTIGCGSVGLLQQAFTAYVGAGDEVVYPWRSFEVHPIFSAIAEAKPVMVPLRDQAFDLDAVAKAVNERTKLVILSTPNNPTGTVCGSQDLNNLLEAVSDDVVVIIDEAYLEFVTDGSVKDPVTEILPHHDNAVVFRTFSKAYGLANLRVGYALGHSEVIGAIDKVALPFLVNGVAQTAVLASLDSVAENELRERVAEVISERERVREKLSELGWPVTPSQANFLWLPVEAQAGPLFQRLESKGIVTRPFENEGLRVTIGKPEENDRFIQAIGSK
jgi:histidinol-phosphate aminotransferase